MGGLCILMEICGRNVVRERCGCVKDVEGMGGVCGGESGKIGGMVCAEEMKSVELDGESKSIIGRRRLCVSVCVCAQGG